MLPRDLADLAAAIERLEALIAADAAPAADETAAVERIADIAFVLHERAVEASLCDALDAAVREIAGAGALKQASMQRTQQAAELLRELSRRVNDMMALARAEQRAAPPLAADSAAVPGAATPATAATDDEETTADEEIPADGLFAADVPEDDEFARVVAVLAGSLPEPVDQAEPASAPHPDAADIPARPDEPQPPEPPAQLGGAARAAESEAGLPSSVAGALFLGEFLSEPSMPQNSAEGKPPSEESSAGKSSDAEPAVVEVAREPAASEQAASDLPIAELAIAAESPRQLPGEESAGAEEMAPLPTEAIVPTGADENMSPAEPEAPAAVAVEASSPAMSLAGEGSSEPTDAPASDSTASFLPERADTADLAVEEPADQDAAHRDVEDAGEVRSSSESVRQDAEMADRTAASTENAEEIFEPLRTGPPRSSLPAEPALGPEDDPGDLFEPMDAALGAPAEQAARTVVPPVVDAEAKSLSGASSVDGAKPASSPRSGPDDAKPSAPPLPPRVGGGAPLPPAARPAPADPLAPVRALSEEEMIALFS